MAHSQDRPTKTQQRGKNSLGAKHKIVVATGPFAGETLNLTSLSVTIGSLETCELYLDDRFVSRKHCKIELEEGAHFITDLESKNGTFVNGLRITRIKLIPGAIIRVGSADLLYQSDDQLQQGPPSEASAFGEVWGRSLVMRQLFGLLEKIAPTDLTLLINGETGTGKEVLARSVHSKSLASKGPFVVIDCGAVAGNLIESELFGAQKGAFTGAMQDRAGAFEAANGGTIFLDEIGELPIDLQPKILRVLEQKQIQRLGSVKPIKVQVRVLAATHRDLTADVAAGRFRQDLYYRLSVVRLKLPALRERIDDLPLLVEHLLAGQSKIKGISPSAINLLMRHNWPGNIRELKNVIQRAAVLAHGPDLQPQDIQLEPSAQAPSTPTSAAVGQTKGLLSLDEMERKQIQDMLETCNGNKSETARRLGIATSTLYLKLKKFQIG